jgi:hypothetical protein
LDRVLWRADFIKVDVEGYECQVLRGASGIVESGRPLSMLVEVWPSQARASGADTVATLGWLSELGFRFWTINNMNTGPLVPATIQHIASYERSGGYVYVWMERA